MEINGVEYLKRNDLIYWIDEWFVQETAKRKIGRELTEDEIISVTKSIEWGLSDSVYEVTQIAINLATDKDEDIH
jgi:hypothetical protein